MDRRAPLAPAGGAVARVSVLGGNWVRWIVLAIMGGLLGLYVLLHSPARFAIAGLLHAETRGCYFCADAWSSMADPLSGLALVATAILSGWALSAAFSGTAEERVLVFGLSALALISVPAAAIGNIGYFLSLPLLRAPAGPLLAASPAALVLAVALAYGWRPRIARVSIARPPALILLFGFIAGGLQVVSVAISLAHPPNSGDALSYHAPLAIYLWRDGNLGKFLERAPDIWALAHPGAAELWYGLLGMIAGESLADLGQVPFAWLGAVAVFSFARRLGLRRGAALLAGSAFLLAPMTVLQVAAQPNDILCAALLMAVVALASAPTREWNWSRLIALGAGMGLVATTKLALLPAVAGVGVFIAGALIQRAHRSAGAGYVLSRLALSSLAFLAVVSPWWIRNIVHYGNPLFPAALPVVGRGVFVAGFGPIDISFVPGAAAWPLYPALEAHDDRSGFGALLLVGMLPGLIYLISRRRTAPVALYAVVTAVMLPAWWIETLHEPRFLLGLVGLGFAFVPWALVAVPRSVRRWGAVLLGLAALVSALVTVDQGLLPLARQPIARDAFYDQVWAVDAAATDLPENEALLLNTGYAPLTVPEYAAFYPLLGPTQSRLVLPIEGESSTDAIINHMRSMGIRYAYVLASPSNRAVVEAKYNRADFELVHSSSIVQGGLSGARRNLFRLATPAEESSGTTRYLFHLR